MYTPPAMTDRTSSFLKAAMTLAEHEKHSEYTNEHLLKVFLDDSDGLVLQLIELAGGNVDGIRQDVNNFLSQMKTSTNNNAPLMSVDLVKTLNLANGVSLLMGDKAISPDRLLAALAKSGSFSEKTLSSHNASVGALDKAIETVRKGRVINDVTTDSNFDALKRYTKDITEQARSGKMDPVIGRDDEIRRTIQILARRFKNNPILIGEPGVGKTSILEGLAQRIINNDVPEVLQGKIILSLDIGAVLSGTKLRGEFEARFQEILKEIERENGRVILFIDEIHMLMNAGGSEGSINGANLIKPALARGLLHCIGATTLDEYREHVEKDKAIVRRFQPVTVKEPNAHDAITMLRGVKERYELHHGVRITDAALVAAVTLSQRYMTERFLPDKAFDIMDEASSRIRIQINSRPEALDNVNHLLVRYKIERNALQKENTSKAQERILILDDLIANLQEEADSIMARWSADKNRQYDIHKVSEELDKARSSVAMFQRCGDLERASQLMYKEIPSLEKSLESLKQGYKVPEVTEETIATIIARSTGIPIERLESNEKQRLSSMASVLGQRVIGQERAIKRVVQAVRRARAGIQDQNRPVGSFLFLGPTGVGKTELAKAVAEFLFDDENAMLRIDMSEYMSKESVTQLVGAPAGYIGHENAGILTESVRRHPYQVVLFDEVEKAHVDVFNILLQVLDDGRLTDNRGNTVDFRNTIIILTSNLGASAITDLKDGVPVEQAYDEVMTSVKAHFKPEFLNRLDDITLFSKLQWSDMGNIVSIHLKKLKDLLKKKDITLSVDNHALNWLSKKGYDPAYGARPLKRVIQRYIQNPLAELMLDGPMPDNNVIIVSEKKGYLTMNGHIVQDD